MILYNGHIGSLGRYFEPALKRAGLQGYAIQSLLEDREGLKRELDALAPTRAVSMVQMAARVPVPECEADPEGTYKINVTDTSATLAEIVGWAQRKGLETSVLFVSSGHVYAAQERGSRIREDAATAPRSVYARTKMQGEQALAQLAAERGFSLRIARVFGLIAPAQPPSYVLPGMIRRVREERLSGIPGLSYVRDYLDSRDVCAGLLRLLATPVAPGQTELVNLCSGEEVTLRQMLEAVARVVRPADAARLVAAATEAPGRPDDIPWIVGDPSRFKRLTGAPPKTISLQETVADACAAR